MQVSDFLKNLQKALEKVIFIIITGIIFVQGIISIFNEILNRFKINLNKEFFYFIFSIVSTCLFLSFLVLYIILKIKKDAFIKTEERRERLVTPFINKILNEPITEEDNKGYDQTATNIIKEFIIYSNNDYLAPNANLKSKFKINLKEAICKPENNDFFARYSIIKIHQFLKDHGTDSSTNDEIKIGAHTNGNIILAAKICEYLEKTLYICNSSGIGLLQGDHAQVYEIYPKINKFNSNDILIFIHDVNMGMRSSVKACESFVNLGIKRLFYFVVVNRCKTDLAETILVRRLNQINKDAHFYAGLNLLADNELEIYWNKSVKQRRE